MQLQDGDEREEWARKLQQWMKPCLPRPCLVVMLAIGIVIITGIWPLIDFTTQLMVVDEITIREVANCTIETRFIFGSCEQRTLEECSRCEEIVKNYTVGKNILVKCRTRTNIFNITQRKKIWIWHKMQGIEYIGPGEKHGCYQEHQKEIIMETREPQIVPTPLTPANGGPQIEKWGLYNPKRNFQRNCAKYYTRNKYTMYETPKKMWDPFSWIKWYNESTRIGETTEGISRYSRRLRTLYQISIVTRKF